MSGRLLTAHEDERRRLARELHDDLTQRLARLAIDAGKLERARGGRTHRPMRKDLVRLSEDVHALSYRLHPSVLDDLGLVEALRAECDRVARSGELRVEVDAHDVPEAVPSETSLCLFRVAQEALNNAARHARASAVTVLLSPRDRGLQLAVSDNGSGFDPAGRANARAWAWPACASGCACCAASSTSRARRGAAPPWSRGCRHDATSKPRVLLADDHRIVAEGLKSLLEEEFELAGIVEDGRAMVKAARELHPDVIVADISMPLLNGIDALAHLKQHDPDVRVVFLTMHRDVAYARRALEAGAAGFVLKHSASAELVLAVRAALQGRTFVTPDLATELMLAAKQGARAGRSGIGVDAAAARDPAVDRRGQVGQGDRGRSEPVGAHRRRSQIPSDGATRHREQRRADPLCDQARAGPVVSGARTRKFSGCASRRRGLSCRADEPQAQLRAAGGSPPRSA